MSACPMHRAGLLVITAHERREHGPQCACGLQPSHPGDCQEAAA